MSTRVSLLLISLAIILLPWLLWQVRPVRRVAPLAVVQIVVGVMLGPSLLGHLAPGMHAALFTRPVLAALDGVSAIGVLLYVFTTGLHLDGAQLRREGRSLGLIAAGSVAAPLLLGLAAGACVLQAIPGALGTTGSAAGLVAAVAICTAVTALPVLAAILGELGMLGSRIGQTALALAALNDAALWVMLAALLAWTGPGAGGFVSLGLAGLWFVLLIGVARPIAVRLAGAEERALLVAGVALATASAAVSEALGTGYLIGAFAAGAIIPPPCRGPLLARVELLTATVLLPFFFMSTGLKAVIDPSSGRFLALVALLVAATVVGKLVGTALPARRAGHAWGEALSLGALMQTKGLMEVVVLGVLHEAGLIGTPIFSGMVAMAIVCTIITAPAVRLCQRSAVSALQRAATAAP